MPVTPTLLHLWILSLQPGFLWMNQQLQLSQPVLGSLCFLPPPLAHLLLFFPIFNSFQAEAEVQHEGMCVQTAAEARDTLSSFLFLSLPAQGFVNPLPTPALSWITALSPPQKYVLCPHCIKHWLRVNFSHKQN